MSGELSGPQRRLLEAIADGTKCPVRGNSYRVARVLAERGLVHIDPALSARHNRMASITDAGHNALKGGSSGE